MQRLVIPKKVAKFKGLGYKVIEEQSTRSGPMFLMEKPDPKPKKRPKPPPAETAPKK